MRRAIEIRRRVRGEIVDKAGLVYADRLIDHGVLETARGEKFLVGTPNPLRVHPGDAFVLDDDRLVQVVAADEPLDEVRGGDFYHLTRIAWMLGARGVPVQVEPFRLLVPRDIRVERHLKRAGASLTPVREPFVPEGDEEGSALLDWHLEPRYD